MSVKDYLQKFYENLRDKSELDFTVHHLCCSHMLQDFIRALKRKNTSKRCRKSTRTFILQCFAALQNCTSLDRGKEIFKHFCIVLCSYLESQEVQSSTNLLKKLFHGKKLKMNRTIWIPMHCLNWPILKLLIRMLPIYPSLSVQKLKHKNSLSMKVFKKIVFICQTSLKCYWKPISPYSLFGVVIILKNKSRFRRNDNTRFKFISWKLV